MLLERSPILEKLKEKMEKTTSHFQEEISQIRGGRISPSLVENISISAYGKDMPLLQLAAIFLPNPKTILVQPWDRSLLTAIEKSINEANLGVSCSADGQVLRINFPPLDSEARNRLIRVLSEKTEASKISLRNSRREALEEIERLRKEKKISEDDFYRLKEELNKLIHQFDEKIDSLSRKKEKDLAEI